DHETNFSDCAILNRYRQNTKLLSTCALRWQGIRLRRDLLLRLRAHGHIGKAHKHADEHQEKVDLHLLLGLRRYFAHPHKARSVPNIKKWLVEG
ncbi:MAG TPA: hypothetical protein VK825_10665, partial [Xanthobacteraceae bacterium]|nr:hypothetical protein [Xanthobacteraceae bacterium]